MYVSLNRIKRALRRVTRVITFRKGVYCLYGKDNHFSDGCILYENAKVGNGNYFAAYTIVNNASIGNFCSIGPGCRIGLANHDLHAVSTSPRINNGAEMMSVFDLSNPAIIDNDVWLGANVVVKQGVHVGTGAVIGAGAVIVHDVPPYSIVAGVPGKVVHYRFSPDVIEKLLSSEWFISNSIGEAKKAIIEKKLQSLVNCPDN